MRRMWILALAAALAAGLSAQEKKQSGAAPAKAAPAVKEPQLPEGAVPVKDGLWRWVDKDGKAWFYQRTPFGFSRYEEELAKGEDPELGVGVTAVEDGDIIRFERPTPFGIRRWTNKKSDLTPDETAAWKRAQRRKAEADKAASEEKAPPKAAEKAPPKPSPQE